jgi:uncharacterized protein (DUF433 family)
VKEGAVATRKIVRDPGTLSGRWRLEGTQVPIADIRRHADLSRTALKHRFADIGLTDEEIDAVMSFSFPAIREASVTIDQTAVTVHCECGEHTGQRPTAPETEISCPCGRTWRVRVELERVSGP